MIKEIISQLVQDVHDGNESAIRANEILLGLKSLIIKCQNEIEDLVLIEENGRVHKNNDS